MTRRGLLLTMTEPPAAMEEEFNAWYDSEHMAERLAIPGFRSARRWTADTRPGDGKYLATYELDSPQVLLSAEYLLAEGNHDVILCERGIRGFDTATRNVFDLTAIPVVHKLSHLPIIADPSHGTGLREKVIPMARAAVAAGADGIMVEVHPDPTAALSDGAQSLFPEQFAQLMQEVRVIAEVIGRRMAEPAPVGA